jgi:hypothetical protein
LKARTLVSFRDGVSCRREPAGPLGLTLYGRTRDRPEEQASVAFSGPAPEGLPEALEAATVEQLEDGTYRIACEGGEWLVSATAAHLHREVAAAFYRAVPPRRPPWSRRVFFRIVLGLARHPAGQRLLFALRRRA